MIRLVAGVVAGYAVGLWVERGRPRVVFKIGQPVESTDPTGAVQFRGTGRTLTRQCERGIVVASMQMTDSQRVTVTANFVDRRGNPVSLNETPEWMTDNPTLLTLTPAADGKTCDVAAAGPLGIGTLTVKADGSGGSIAGTLEIEIVSGAAVNITLTPGTPTEQ